MTDVLDRLRKALADRYAIEREIGSGGMATVYLANDLKHNRQVAVKVLQPDLAVAIGAERFLREIEIAANLPLDSVALGQGSLEAIQLVSHEGTSAGDGLQ